MLTSLSTSFLFALPRDKWDYHNLAQTPVASYTRSELLSLRTMTSLLSLSNVDRLKDLNIGYHIPRRHSSSRVVIRKEQNEHRFIVASFNAQSEKSNYMACRCCKISTFIYDHSDNLFLWMKHGLGLKVTKRKLLN